MPEYQQDVDALGKLWVRSTRGPLVPLSTVARFRYSVGPVTVNHSGQLPSVTVSFNLAPGVSLGTALKEVQGIAADVLPSTVAASFSGIAQAFVSTQQGLLLLMLLAVFVIYVILGVLYESFIHPITILTGLPFAAFGALVTLILCGLDLDIYGFVGIIMLIGIVEKNAIMMIDFAIEAQRDGEPHADRSDPRGGERAVPSDHDDDDGGAHGRGADRGRLGRRRVDAPAARRGGGRRPRVLAARDAVRDAGVLHLPRRVAAVVLAAQRRAVEAPARSRTLAPPDAWLTGSTSTAPPRQEFSGRHVHAQNSGTSALAVRASSQLGVPRSL